MVDQIIIKLRLLSWNANGVREKIDEPCERLSIGILLSSETHQGWNRFFKPNYIVYSHNRKNEGWRARGSITR
jgi:hypothetical protein